jgi:hypothetical protein
LQLRLSKQEQPILPGRRMAGQDGSTSIIRMAAQFFEHNSRVDPSQPLFQRDRWTIGWERKANMRFVPGFDPP